MAFAGAHRDVGVRAAGKHRLVREAGNSAMQILVSLIVVCGVGALKNLLCTTSKTVLKTVKNY
jgi:NCAIR mutase (PurE)-related protein